MEINEPEDTKLSNSNLDNGLEKLGLAEAHSSSEYDILTAPPEALLDNFLGSVKKDASPPWGVKEAHSDAVDNGSSSSKTNTKDSAEAEKQKSFFHLSDNMKKDLSLLTYPSKPQPRKKGVISSRTIPASRITIAEALEKAKDARKSITGLHATSDQPNVKEKGISEFPSNCHSTIVDKSGKESQNAIGPPAGSGAPETPRIRVKKFDLAVTSESVAEGSGSNAAASESASSNEGQTVLLAGKSKSGTSRIQMTRRMWELLKFTFIHEHFPSSVHMARLAKMMGIPWSQVRNWFTDRRVDNKKAGIYPRDRPLTDCPYCNVFLKTEAEQKTHLFSSSHVRRILGGEYCGGVGGGCGGGPSESIKWKKLPKTVNAVSSVSGARILAVGFSAEEGKKEPEKKKMETAVGKPANSRELKKLWTDAMLHPEEKEQAAAEWDSVRVTGEKSSDNHCKPYIQGKRDTTYTLRMADLKEKLAEQKQHENMYDGKVIVNSKVVSIPVNVGDIPSNVSDSVPVTVNSSTTMTTAVSSRDPDAANTTVVSSVMPGDLHLKKHHQTEDMSALLELEMPRKVAATGKKHNIGGRLESSSEKPITLSAELLCKAYKGTFPNVKTKSKSTSSKSGFLSSSNVNRENKSFKSSVITVQDMEVKQEHVLDDSVNNITLYKGDASDGQNKCEAVVVNASKQSVIINQNVSGSPKNLQQLQKTSLGTHDPSLIKSKSGLAVNKISRISIDKRKDKLRTQPLGSVLRAEKTAALAYEGNIIVGYQCPNCNKVYQTEWLMIKHSVTHFKYHCDICFQTYPTENMMKIHLLDHLTGAYEDEKYYCQFSCKICHSLKCGCFEPTYCKPQDLPRLFFRPQKARRSKKGFITKLNSGPNDHLKISLSSYKKLLLSESLGNSSKEKLEKTAPQKTVVFQDTKKTVVIENDQKASSVADSQKPVIVLREVHKPNTLIEASKVPTVERESKEYIIVKTETTPAVLTKERDPVDSVASVSGEQVKLRPIISTVEKDLILAREKQQNWKRIKRKLALSYERDATPSPQPPCPNKLEETEDAPGTKRGGGRRRTAKQSSNFVYDDTDFYYMCEICDASFTCKAELSEHMFLHRLKSRSRGEKRGISWAAEEKVPKKVKVSEVQDQTSTPIAAPENHTCELCHTNFSKMADYYAHKIMAHNETPEQPPQKLEVFRCNYCDKIYRRRRELKRHLKRDCTHAPSSLKGELSSASSSNNAIEEAHYTTVKIDFDDRSDAATKFVSRGAARGPIICKYCLAVTKREAEMKRHIWKFCLKVPADVVKKFMDGASLEELGFKYIREEASIKGSSTNRPQNTPTDISVSQSAVEGSLDKIQSVKHPESCTESSSEKQTSLEVKSYVLLESPEINPTKYSSQMPPHQKISHVQKSTSPDPNILEKKTLSIQGVFEESDTEKVSEMETSDVQSVSSEGQSLSTVPAEESVKNEPEKLTPVKSSSKVNQPPEKQSPNKSHSEETKIESSGGADEAAQSAASTSPLASPVMQFPVVVPVMTASQKSKRPLVCGYCGIWYFREMAILKHMKERCIKIPEFEKTFLIQNSSLCNVAQKVGGVDLAAENGAVYKMVKMPEHLQNSPILVPKDVTNEDIKELNKNIKAYSESTPTEAKPSVNERVEAPPVPAAPVAPAAPAANTTRSTTGKRGSRCRRCHEHFSSQEAVLAHSSVHHGPKKGFYKCKLCHARLVKYKQLREHVWEHTNENPYRCHLCQVRYRSSDLLVDHLLTKHQYTSINDKNLYKWLPGRHGKYRDIKAKVTDCEEKLDDVDTNLDSVAEVMVITDKDICSERDESKDTKGNSDKQKQSEGSEIIKEDNESLQKNSTCNKNLCENNCISNESKTAPESSTSSSDHTFDSNAISENVTADKMYTSKEGKRNTKVSSVKISCDGSIVKQTTVQDGSEDEEQTLPANSLTGNKSKSDDEQNRETISKGTDTDDAESGTIDNYTGEGLLPLVDNLDSVVETIHLTDKHLS
ncbi:uncharacterized protein LOC135092159 [Scylla paramamosain]|uniref:uncharacterized protein LOC135092159 n=1 Tax=Scylla paramamosain TaxID=85552 RepID=UPI0030831BCF